jgi:ABC-type nitrate/sulfonate/bicarbonate transport system substrate-binding protein
MTRLRIVPLFAAFLITSSLAAPASAPAGPALATIRAGRITADLSVFPVVWAQERGIYRNAGIETRFLDFGSGTDAIRALVTGDIDVFLTTMYSTLALLKARGPADIWAVFQLSDHPIFLLVVRAQGPVHTVADLKGRRIAITRFGSGSDFLARAIVRKAGLRADEDVTLVQAGSIPAAIAAVERGEIEAAVAWHPLAAEAVQRGSVRVLVTAKEDTPGLEPTTPAMRGEFLQRNLPLARAFVKGTVDGLRDLRRNTPLAIREAARIHQIPEPIAKTTIDYYGDVWTRTGRFDEKGLLETQLWLIRIGQIERLVPQDQLLRKDVLP